MIKIKIERLDEPDGMSYTNTGLPKHKPLKEVYENCDSDIGLFLDYKSVYLEFDEDWNIFSSPLMKEVDWYTRTYFSSAKKVNISIDIEGVDK
jgi:hypothetical protein